MALPNATFKKNQVALFLDRNFPYAAIMFAEENAFQPENIPSTVVENWFKSYFPFSISELQYRKLEVDCTQTWSMCES